MSLGAIRFAGCVRKPEETVARSHAHPAKRMTPTVIETDRMKVSRSNPLLTLGE